MSISAEQAMHLRQAFPPEAIGQLPKGGAMLDYVGHAATTDRLLSVDPEWSWEPFSVDERGLPALDTKGNLWIRLTVCGVTRIGVGDGKSAKECIGDAIRNAAMRFGVALDLWSKEELEQGAPKAGRKKAAVESQSMPTGETVRMSRTTRQKSPRESKEAKMFALFAETGRKDKAAMLEFISKICGRTVESRTDMSDEELASVVTELQIEAGQG